MATAQDAGTAAAVELTDEQLAHYRDNGFVVIENLVSEAELAAMQERLREYTHGGRSQERLAVQIEPRVTRGELSVDHPGDGIRKIDGLVESDDLYQALGRHPNIVGVLARIFGPDIKMFRNAVLLKPPEVGSAKGMHQDSPYWPIRPMELCSCWFAIDEATVENGCMGVIAGAHRDGPPAPRARDRRLRYSARALRRGGQDAGADTGRRGTVLPLPAAARHGAESQRPVAPRHRALLHERPFHPHRSRRRPGLLPDRRRHLPRLREGSEGQVPDALRASG